MTHPPYTLVEAQNICVEFKHLIGAVFNKNTMSLIDSIVVAPYGQTERNRFLMLYLTLNDAHVALHDDFSGSQYTVLLLSGSVEANNLAHEELHKWLVTEKRHTDISTYLKSSTSVSSGLLK